MLKRSVIHDKRIDKKKYNVPQIVSFIRQSGLFSTLNSSNKYNVQLVREVVNLTKEFGDSSSPYFGVVVSRGKKMMISPRVINEYCNLLNV